jgi:hypothetical protein
MGTDGNSRRIEKRNHKRSTLYQNERNMEGVHVALHLKSHVGLGALQRETDDDEGL